MLRARVRSRRSWRLAAVRLAAAWAGNAVSFVVALVVLELSGRIL
jgi:hypothetical protein